MILVATVAMYKQRMLWELEAKYIVATNEVQAIKINFCENYGHRFYNYDFDHARCIVCGKERE